MIDHHEQHCRQILTDELEAVSPSLATWAAMEFDAGTTSTSIRRVLFDAAPNATRLFSDAKALADSIQRDETGDMIGGQFVGNGNGGNLSTPSLQAKGRLQRTLNAIKEG